MKTTLFQTFSKTNKNFKALFLKVGWVVFFIIFATHLIQQQLAQQLLLHSGDSMNQLLINLNLMIISLTEGLLLTLLIPLFTHNLQNQSQPLSFSEFAYLNGLPLILESLRVFASVLLHLLLFFIPGVIRYTRLQFVPFVVMFDNKYKLGHVDALERSSRMVKGHTFIFFLILVIIGILQLVIDKFSLSYSLLQTPLLSFLLLFIKLFFYLYIYSFTYFLFAIRHQQTQNDGERRDDSHT